MEDDVKVCKRKSCPRFNVLVTRPTSRYCSACGGKLKRFYEPSDTPPLRDDAPDPRSVTHSPRQSQLSLDDKGEIMAPRTSGKLNMPTREDWQTYGGTWEGYNLMLRANGLETFQEFVGDWPKYVVYLTNCGVGAMKDPDEIKAFIARIVAYAASRNIDIDHIGGSHPVNTTYRGGEVVGFTARNKPSDTFTCANEDIKGCPVQPIAEIVMPHDMYRAFIYLCNQHDTEWIAYLHGDRSTDASGKITWTITDCYFPKQKATSAHVDVVQPQSVNGEVASEIRPNTIGSIHSHVSMNVFFSQEDVNHFNFPVELVINRKGELDVAVAHTLECGRTTRLGGKVFTTASEGQTNLNAALKAQLTSDRPTSGGGPYASYHD